MHSLETLAPINAEAARRELTHRLGTAAMDDPLPLGPGRPFGLGWRLTMLRARLLAIAAELLLIGCAAKPGGPELAGPCPPLPPGPVVTVRAVAVDATTGAVVGALYTGETGAR